MVDIVAQVDIDPRGGKPVLLRIIQLTDQSEAKRLAPVIEQLYQEQHKASASKEPQAKIIPAQDAARLIVMGTQIQLDAINQIIEQLRAVTQPPQARKLKVIVLKSIKIDIAMDTIEKLLDQLVRRAFSSPATR